MTTIKITQNDDVQKRLDIFITCFFDNLYPRAKISSYIDEKVVLVNGKRQKPSYKLKLNDTIEYSEDEFDEFFCSDIRLIPYNYNLDIKYEDDDLMVINKPKEMLSHPTKFENDKTLCNALIYHCGDNLSNLSGKFRPGIVHRLDKNTAGLMLVAKNNFAHEILAKQIKEKKAKRKYLALSLGEFEKKEGIIDKPLVHYIKNNVKMSIAEDRKGLEAITKYKVLEQFKGCALVELELETGRTHQIRAHLASIKHPVFGDSLYGAKSYMRNEFYNLKTTQQLLQSYCLSFYHPRTNKLMEFKLNEKDFSKDFIKVLNFLRSKNEH